MLRELPRFCLVWFFFLVLLAGILGWGYWFENQTQLRLVKSSEEHAILNARQIIYAEIGMLKRDIQYLSEQNLLQYFLAEPNTRNLQTLQSEYQLFLRHNPQYVQLRYIDNSGIEIVRINNNAGKIIPVKTSDLQNKGQRYYVMEGLQLAQGELYLSPMDLNVEKGVIARPRQPVLRISAPVFDLNNEKRGIVVLNYQAQDLIDQLEAVELDNYEGSLWLINREGYWLAGPGDATWGFQLPGRENNTLAHRFPDLWQALREHDGLRQLETRNSVFSGAVISLSQFGVSKHPERWYIVANVTQAQLEEKKVQRRRKLWVNFFTLGLILGAVIAAATYWRTLHRQSIQKAEDTEKRFQYLLSSAPDAIIVTDKDGVITLCNPQTEILFSYAQHELIGQPVEMLMPPEFREQHQRHRQTYLQNPTARLMMSGRELIALNKTGSEIPVEISLSPLRTREGLFITVIIRDISARKRAEMERLVLEKRFREMVDNVPVGVFRKNTVGDGRFIEINQAMVKMFEADSARDLIEKSVANIHSFISDVEKIRALLNASGQINNQEFLMKTVKGRQFYAEISAALRLDDQGDDVIDGIIEDISERKQRDVEIAALNRRLNSRTFELEAINQELEAFSYSVSHDLRAPLRAIDGFSRTLFNDYKDTIDERGLDRLTRVRKAAQRMAVLIDDLLRLSRVSRTGIHIESINLSVIAEEVIDDFRQAHPNRFVQVSIQPGIIAEADGQLMRVVFENLLGNAYKFTGNTDHAKIEVGSFRVEEGLVCFIRDNGAGFDMAYADKLFGAFQRLHNEEEFQGSGIGLATVQRVIHKHRGKVWAESAPGQGATFYFSLG